MDSDSYEFILDLTPFEIKPKIIAYRLLESRNDESWVSVGSVSTKLHEVMRALINRIESGDVHNVAYRIENIDIGAARRWDWNDVKIGNWIKFSDGWIAEKIDDFHFLFVSDEYGELINNCEPKTHRKFETSNIFQILKVYDVSNLKVKS